MSSKHHTVLNDSASDVERCQVSVGALNKTGHVEAIVGVVIPCGSCDPEDLIMVHALFVCGVSGKPQQNSFKQATEIFGKRACQLQQRTLFKMQLLKCCWT